MLICWFANRVIEEAYIKDPKIVIFEGELKLIAQGIWQVTLVYNMKISVDESKVILVLEEISLWIMQISRYLGSQGNKSALRKNEKQNKKMNLNPIIWNLMFNH